MRSIADVSRGRSIEEDPQYTSAPMRQFLIVLTLIATAASAQTKRAATFDDVLGIKAIQGPQISPDGRPVIDGVRQWVEEEGKKEARTHVCRVATDGNSPAHTVNDGASI